MDARVPRAQDAHERPADFENMDVFDVGRDAYRPPALRVNS